MAETSSLSCASEKPPHAPGVGSARQDITSAKEQVSGYLAGVGGGGGREHVGRGERRGGGASSVCAHLRSLASTLEFANTSLATSGKLGTSPLYARTAAAYANSKSAALRSRKG